MESRHITSLKYLYCGQWLQCMSLILYVCQKCFLILCLTCLMTELIQKDTIIKEQTTLIIIRERSLYVFQRTPSILRRNNFCNLPECLATEIRKGKNKWFFTCLYRSPSQNSVEFDTFCSTLNLLLSNINDLNPASSVLIGYYNARTSKWWSSNEETFEGHAIHSLTTLAVYAQLIDQPTHVTNNSSSCVDLGFSILSERNF